MPEISDERLDEILAAAEKATPGPWMRSRGEDNALFQKAGLLLNTSTNNLDYLASVDPTTISTLIAEVKAARAGKGVGTIDALCAAFEHAVTQQTQAYQFKHGTNTGTWLFRCDEWFDLARVLSALPSLEPQGAQEAVVHSRNILPRKQMDPWE